VWSRTNLWLHHWRLDRELAQGLSPEQSQLRAARAQQLVAPCERRRLARSLRHAVSRAESPQPPGVRRGVPIRRDEVQAWREGLLGLADRLDDGEAVGACGVARVLRLLTDGAGPLYTLPRGTPSERLSGWPPMDWKSRVNTPGTARSP